MIVRRSRRHSGTRTVLAVALLAGAVAWQGIPARAQTVETFRDDFVSISYAGNSGSSTWSGPWREIGEADGVGAGIAQVSSSDRCLGGSGNCLRLAPAGSSFDGIGVYRRVDLSDATAASLSLYYRRQTQGQVTGSVAVSVSGNGGASWTTLQTLPLSGAQKGATLTFDITSFTGSDTRVRLRGVGATDGGSLFIDGIEIAATTVASSSTSSTTTTAPAGTTTTSTTPPGSTSTTTAPGSSSTTAPPGTVTTTTTPGSSTTTPAGTSPSTTSDPSTTNPGDASSTTAGPSTTTGDEPDRSTASTTGATSGSDTSTDGTGTPLPGSSDGVPGDPGPDAPTDGGTAEAMADGGADDGSVGTVALGAFADSAASTGMLVVGIGVLWLVGVSRRRDRGD
jgi:hypothetical protein